MTMGEDFHYQNAHTWFKNLDKLIKHVNERVSNRWIFCIKCIKSYVTVWFFVGNKTLVPWKMYK